MYKNTIIKAPEISVAFNSLMPPIFSFNEINIGTEPIISITANNVNVTVSSALKSKGIKGFLQRYTGLAEADYRVSWRQR
jgi:hypothetical protein